MKYLIYYSSEDRARKYKLQLQGSVVELNTVKDVHRFMDEVESPLIFHFEGEYPWWADYDHLSDDKERDDDYRTELPQGWENMPWIEIYNGYRE
jgi:hypothetical protein